MERSIVGTAAPAATIGLDVQPAKKKRHRTQTAISAAKCSERQPLAPEPSPTAAVRIVAYLGTTAAAARLERATSLRLFAALPNTDAG